MGRCVPRRFVTIIQTLHGKVCSHIVFVLALPQACRGNLFFPLPFVWTPAHAHTSYTMRVVALSLAVLLGVVAVATAEQPWRYDATPGTFTVDTFEFTSVADMPWQDGTQVHVQMTGGMYTACVGLHLIHS